MNAVACEVQVIATGARPAEAGGKRELFTEETTTALVFENGGVLKLAASVATGQLLFLTHKESKREVVAQVTRKRDFRPTVCYVEVEFSEASPGFWGVKFPEVPAAAPVAAATAAVPAPQRNVEQPERAEQPELAQHAGPVEEDFIGDEPATPTVAPSAHEVAALKTEVEALREQLKLLQTQTAASVMSTEPSQVPVDTAAQGPVPVNAPAPPLPKLRLNTRDEAHGPVTEVSGAAGGEGTVAPPAAAEAASEPNEPSFSEEDLLPKPALNFDTAKPARKGSSKPKSKAEPGQIVAAKGSSSAVRKDLLFAAFVVVTLGAVWYENLLPWLPRPKFFGPSAAPMVTARPAPRAPAKTTAVQADAPKIAKASEAPAAAASAPSTAQNETTRAGNDAKHGAAQPAALEAAKASTPAASEAASVGKAKAASEEAADTAATPEKSMKKLEAVASAKKRAATPALSKAAMVSAEPADEAGMVPPKLIKAVRAVASPNALQEFSSGGAENVTFDAVVDTSGHVKPVKVLSGATALRSAAMEALKQYQYEPATQRGKPVAARVKVTVKFLFEP
jgi:hypothetical protein